MNAHYPSGRRHGEVVHLLGHRIVTGQVVPGEALPTEAVLAEELGVSRGALREAVKVLAGKGLVSSRTRTGTIVQPQRRWHLMDPDVLAWRYRDEPTRKHLDDLAEVRVAIEPEAARLAARGASDDELVEIGDCFARMEHTLSTPDEFIAADLAFHQAVVAASGNDLFVAMFDLLGLALAEVRQVHTRSVRRNRQTLPDHEAVLRALEDRDEDQAYQLMRLVVTEAAHDVRKARRRQPKAS